MTSEGYSAASELSSRTFYQRSAEDHRPAYPRSSSQGSKRGLDVSGEESEDITPTKRAASCKADDLSCQEATLFDRGADSLGAYAFEAESQLFKRASCPVPATCSINLREMIRSAYTTENVDRPSARYMARHGQAVQSTQFLEPSMRMVAVSWLVEVACEFSLQQETLFLAANLLDRFLTHAKAVPRNHLQLTAVACMMIAAKHEEKESHPSVQDFTNIADNCFQPADLLRMESLILQRLAFRVIRPNAFTLLSLLRQALGLSQREAALATYLTELSMLEYNLLRYQPSIIAASAVLLSQAARRGAAAVEQLGQVSGYHPAALLECAEELRSLQEQAFDAVDAYNPLVAVKEKYRDIRWHCISHEQPVDASALRVLAAKQEQYADMVN